MQEEQMKERKRNKEIKEIKDREEEFISIRTCSII
jgi:hypothetical protein